MLSNHIHLIVIPPDEELLAIAIRRTHGRYAQEDSHLWAALRYVERNRVRAGLVASPADWEWSSARAHLGLTTTFGCLDRDFWQQAGGAQRWQSLLAEPEPEEWLKRFRRATYAGNPFGSEEFIERARQTRNTAGSLITPAAWIREPSPPCYGFSGKGAL